MIECLTQAHTDIMLTQLPEAILKYRFSQYHLLHLCARQLPQATDEAVLGLARPPWSQNDRMILLRISCHTTVVRF